MMADLEEEIEAVPSRYRWDSSMIHDNSHPRSYRSHRIRSVLRAPDWLRRGSETRAKSFRSRRSAKYSRRELAIISVLAAAQLRYAASDIEDFEAKQRERERDR